MKNTIKALKYFLLSLGLIILVVYIVLIFIGGGFGEKSFSNLAISEENPLFFAHRGHANDFPENSIGAMTAALNTGYTALEIDVRLTEDDILVVFHDKSGERLLKNPVKINQSSYKTLRNYPLFHSHTASQNFIPKLEEVFETFGTEFIFYLDVKYEEGLEYYKLANNLYLIIEKFELAEQVIVANSNIFLISYLEYNFPKINTALEGFNSGKEWIYPLIPKRYRPDFLASFQNQINRKHVDWLKKKGLLDRKIAYGVSHNNLKETICSFGVRKVILDYHMEIDSVLQGKLNCQ